MPSSSSPWQQSPPWKKLRTTTPLCLLWTSRQTNIRSSTLSRSCMTLMLPKSTLSSGRNLNLDWAAAWNVPLETDMVLCWMSCLINSYLISRSVCSYVWVPPCISCIDFIDHTPLINHLHLFRPDGEKKAYVRLAPDYDALDVANKVSLAIYCGLSS